MEVSTIRRKKFACALVSATLLLSQASLAAAVAPTNVLDPVFLSKTKDVEIISALYAKQLIHNESVAHYIMNVPVVTEYEYGLIIGQVLCNVRANKDLDEETIDQLKELAQNNDSILTAIVGDSSLSSAIQNMKPKQKPKPQTSVSSGDIPLQIKPLSLPKKETPAPVPTPPPLPPKPVDASPLGEISQDSLNKLQKSYAKIHPPSTAADTAKETTSEKRTFWTEITHHFFYTNTSTSGNVPLDNQRNLDDMGNPQHRTYENQFNMREELIVKLLWNVTDSLRLATGFRAYNDNGWLADKNRQVGFDNIVASIKDRTMITLGRFAANFGGYSVNTSNLKGINIDDKHDGTETTIFFGKNSTTDSSGAYSQQAWGLKYLTDKLIKNIQATFSFVNSKDVGDPTNPSAPAKSSHSLISMALKGNITGGSISGEITRSTSSGQSLTAMYLDVAKRFSDKLKGTLHFVDVSSDYNSGLVDARKAGIGIQPYDVGKADYPYDSGQHGFDLAFSYILKQGVANLQFGFSNYSRTTEGNSLRDWYLAANHLWQVTDGNRDIAKINLAAKYENRTVDGVKRTIMTTMLDAAVSPWKNAVMNIALHKTYDSAATTNSDNMIELATGLKQQYKVSERTTITPEVSIDLKRGSSLPGSVDARTLITAITVDQQIVPKQLSIALRLAYENHSVKQGQISATTGENLDGNSRKLTSIGLNVNFAPKIADGLTLGAGYAIENVHNYSQNTVSKEDVFTASAGYARPINDDTKASLNYEYSYRRDKAYPINNELKQTLSAEFNISMGKNSRLQLNQSYEKHVKPSDPNANYNASQSTIDLVNKF